ncbi:hypothetical protein NUU61_003528 [Penicillium alfredii]|uniref:Uncharacterized protein n=1 Tax=Penicillium alfredii TaxID=1506179 RepID=A0A9W9FJE1_9EURO|nr:uncharacterized protein NUU61_003528 [Penicillium alfredii]KAJ5101306.1 hypothetical protein NUU61_003528 [Penicillium alfredii]
MQNSLARNLKIEVRLRSASKASRNDPRPTPSPEYYIRRMNEDLPVDASYESPDDGSDDISFTSCSENDIFAEFEWLEQIDGLILDEGNRGSDGIQVGYCDGKLIRREKIRSQFRYAMEQPSEEMCLLAFDIMDRYGCLKPEFKSHAVKKGSGIWSAELNNEKAREKTLGFVAIARPDILSSEALCEPSGEEVSNKESLESAARDISKSFWRSLGFRRISSSSWFGLASDPEHLCYHLAADDDFEIPAVQFSVLDPEVERSLKMALESTDNDCVEVLYQVFKDAAEDDPRWTSTDANGNSVLHLTAAKIKPNSVRWILSRSKVLLQQRNIQGETPLDALLAKLEDSRTNVALMR